MQFLDGDELIYALQRLCKETLKSGEIFSDFHAKLNLVLDDENNELLAESTTVDVGGWQVISS